MLGSRWDSKGVGDAEGRRTGVAERDRIPLRQIKQNRPRARFVLFDGVGLVRSRLGSTKRMPGAFAWTRKAESRSDGRIGLSRD